MTVYSIWVRNKVKFLYCYGLFTSVANDDLYRSGRGGAGGDSRRRRGDDDGMVMDMNEVSSVTSQDQGQC